MIVSDNTYGGTFRFFDKVLTRYALSFSYVDTSRLDEVERAFTPATRMLFVETPTNPVMQITDLRNRAEHEKNVQELRVLRRTLAGLFAQAAETGGPQLEAKKWTLAAGYYELASLARHTPQLRPLVREGAVAALRRVLEDEQREIVRGGVEYLELQDARPG